ncbi:MAG: histidine kinase [Acidobacteriota bacterium]|nr:histidine kinase [Acidobacteriota bacterium]
MIGVSLTFLVICMFGAFAYGSATLMALRQATPVWGAPPRRGGAQRQFDGVSLTMFVLCTAWFALSAVAEFRGLAGAANGSNWVDLTVFALAFLFPPLIMQVVFRETRTDCAPSRTALWQWPMVAMYLISPIAGAYLVGAGLGAWARPEPFGRVIGLTFGVLFTATSAYSAAIMIRRRARPSSTNQLRHGNAMLSLFFMMTVIFLTVAALNDRSTLVEIFSRLARTAPILFLAVAVYFENRFEFYDLVIKRGVMLIATIVAFGLLFMLAQPLLDQLPPGAVRPWLAAIILVPAAMGLPWMSRTLSSSLDRLWFGRKFSAVDAVKHLLGAMQPATSETTLAAEAEQRLADIFNAPIKVRVDDQPTDEGRSVEVEGATPSGGRVRFVVMVDAAARRLLSEDLAMLRSLANVFGFMLETIRLQQKRQEQEQVAQELRLQTSRSELKALRAQINPHFLFNALNAIASLIHTDPGRADEAVEQLAEVFRYTLRRSDTEWAPLDQELSFARAYLDVERARFGPRLTFTIDADSVSPVPLVPSMLLQTLIENAVKHGVAQTRGPGRIEVMVRTAGQDLTVEVRDNGPGPAAEGASSSEGEGFGLRSVRERLAGHFGDRARLSLLRDEASGMTIARITMPVARVAA